MHRSLALLTASLLLALASACGDSEPGGSSEPGPDAGGTDSGGTTATDLDTDVTPNQLAAGEVATVTCLAFDDSGASATADDLFFTVNPSEGTTIDGMTVTFTIAGSYTVRCKQEALGLQDETPALVTVSAGPPATSIASVNPATINAGGSSAVECTGADAWGNEATAEWVPAVAPPGDVDVDGANISADVAGSYEVTCTVAGITLDEATAATWTVQPGPPVSLELRFEPDRKAYRVKQKINVVGVATDSLGNVTEGVPLVDLGADPEGNETVSGDPPDQISFDVEGIYTVSAGAADAPDVTASGELAVDQTPPVLEITAPARGTVQDAVTSATVTGTVTDNLGTVALLEVAGQPVELPAAGGDFSVDVPLEYGMNLITVRAADPYDLTTETSRTVEWSTGWYALETPTLAGDGVGKALAIVLDQEAIDDGDHDPTNPNDLATIAEVVLSSMDLGALLPDPLTSFGCIGGDCEVKATGLSFADPQVSLALIDGGLHLSLDLADFAITIELRAPCALGEMLCPGGWITMPGTYTADVVTFDTDLMLGVDGGGIVAETTNTDLTVEGIGVEINDPTGLLSSIVDLAVGFIAPGVETVLAAVLPGLIEDQVGSALGDALGQLAIEQEIELPGVVDGLPSNVLVLSTEIWALAITPQYLRLDMTGLVHTQTPARPHPVPGSIRFGGCGLPGVVPTPPNTPLAAGVHDDFLNQLVFAVWEGGTIALDLDPSQTEALDLSSYGIQNMELLVDALLPPIINTCGGEQLAQIGDLYLDASFELLAQPAHISAWLQAAAVVDITVAEGEGGATSVGLVLGEFDPFVIELTANEGIFEGDDEAVVSLLKDQLVGQLLGSLTEDLAFELPAIDLHALSEDIPEGTAIRLDIQSIDRSGPYLVLEGGLE